jgi:segregation and condensation protein A
VSWEDKVEITYKLENLVRSKQELLDDFEGPLDLIVDLLRQNKIDIANLSLTLLVDQYLQWMDEQAMSNPEVTSEFVNMASYLVFLKTKMLLSVGQPEEAEEVDELILALQARIAQEDHQKMLTARAFLEQNMEIGRSIFSKAPDTLDVSKAYTLEHPAEILLAALAEIGSRAARKLPPPIQAFRAIVGKDTFPVELAISSLVARLKTQGSLMIRECLYTGDKEESIATFLAILELCKMRKVRLEPYEDDYALHLAEGEPE